GVYFPVNKELDKISEQQALLALKKGELKILLHGEKLKGEFVLVQFKKEEQNWLLIKHNDEYAVDSKYDAEKLAKTTSVKPTKRNAAKR
ncbi:MAG TPA: DNA ligase, partial [Agriterribacter sp.]|nr:DNA ligase [Agriterribacter sp.]